MILITKEGMTVTKPYVGYRQRFEARKAASGVRIVFNRLLNGWYIVRGPHQAPLGGRFDSRAEAQAHLDRRGS